MFGAADVLRQDGIREVEEVAKEEAEKQLIGKFGLGKRLPKDEIEASVER
jgi:hypothetical protein